MREVSRSALATLLPSALRRITLRPLSNGPLALKAAAPEDADFLGRLFMEAQGDTSPAWRELDPRSAPVHLEQHRAERRSRHPHAETSLITENGEPVGAVTIDRDGPCVHLVEIAVLASRRRRGIASAALRELARTSGRLTVWAWSGNTAAIRLYERHGFSVVSEQFGYALMATEADS